MGFHHMLNLRRARLDDHWKRAFKRVYPTTINAARYSNGTIFNGLEINFKGGINALVGRNGIGKSTLIRSLYNAFVTSGSNREKFRPPIMDVGQVEIHVKNNDVDLNKIFIAGTETDSFENSIGFMYDPCTLIPSVQNLFLAQDNLEELLDGHSALSASNDELQLINFLTNGDYKEVSIINIEDEFENFPILPFFKVKTFELEYDSRSMGLGELSLFYFFWLSRYMLKLDENRILFIEEPESFLPPATQERLSDILAMIAAIDGIAIVLTSHSEHILKRLPRKHVHIMKKTADGIRCSFAIDNNEPLKILGLLPSKEGVLIYEDVGAEIFIKSLLKTSLNFSSDSFYFLKSGSDGELLKSLKLLPKKIENFQFIGTFDGDCRGKYEHLLGESNYCYLPGNVAPEEMLMRFLSRADLNIVSTALGVTATEVLEAKHAAAGCDLHDYFHVFSRSINKSFHETLSKICDLWVSDATNLPDVSSFLNNLERFFRPL
jgi:predicted ATPase